MSSKIFRAIFVVATVVFLSSLVMILGMSYEYFTQVEQKRLDSETALAAQGVACNGRAFLEGLETEDFRITWIASDGQVLYDSNADSSHMENHMAREEVREAFETGRGESIRYSSTLSQKQFYAARRLTDGSVLRVSIEQLAVWTLLAGLAQPIFFIVLLSLVLSFALASRLTNRIVKPINRIDPDNPIQYLGREEYRELEPLLRRITHQQAELKRDQAEIEKTSLIRQEFTANVSHELKTPLHAISGYAELIETGMVREQDIRPFAGKIRMESARLTRLVEDIIELTRLDSRSVDTVDECCDLYRIAENAVGSLESYAASAQTELTLEGKSAFVRGDPQLLHSIVYNLCDNAVKYNRPGGSVLVRVTEDAYYATLTVSDTGIGIPKECQERVFERFYRVDKSRSKDVGGTGLGLSIVKHAAALYLARIALESTPGEGSTFTVTFPK
ncbi:MAG: PAS domain-containing sensor histidine kinase [Oscillospiraceae bacterium]|nr:PAS domain-containing sensor histidine kinase [Oscillospiraceae bacterium]